MNPFQNRVKNCLKIRKIDYQTNMPVEESNGWFQRYKNPILTAAHVPFAWRYDLNEKTNPFLWKELG
jgi:4-O-beta-D-mannosyl-D-glucose phosphorylase